MYINPFWAGVITTLATEFITIIVFGLLKGGRNNGDQ